LLTRKWITRKEGEKMFPKKHVRLDQDIRSNPQGERFMKGFKHLENEDIYKIFHEHFRNLWYVLDGYRLRPDAIMYCFIRYTSQRCGEFYREKRDLKSMLSFFQKRARKSFEEVARHEKTINKMLAKKSKKIKELSNAKSK
jgi:hypothetical protein